MLMEGKIYSGLHGTSKSASEKICAEGFKIFSDDHYFGRGVYFYQPLQKGEKLAKALAKSRAKQRGENEGAIVTAEFKFAADEIVDLLTSDNVQRLRRIHSIASSKYPHLSREKYNTLCNRMHMALVVKVCERGNLRAPGMIQANLPFGRDYAPGYVVLDTALIKVVGAIYINVYPARAGSSLC